MKKYINALFLLFCAFAAIAQAPQKFNYQAVARNNSNTILGNQNVKIRASILDGSAGGASQYVETHSATTSALGLFTLAIGGGAVQSGNFAGITWAGGDKYLKIEMDPAGGNNFSLTGTSQLLSVPYAMYAAKGPAEPVDQMAVIEFRSDGNGFGAANAGQWNKRAFSDVVINQVPGLSLDNSSDIILLQPGQYLVRAFGAANYCNGNVMRFRNTLASDGLMGMPGFSRSDDVNGVNMYSQLEGIITVTSPNAQYLLEHWIQSNPVASQVEKIFGDFANLPAGIPSVWTRIVIQKLK